MLWYYLKRSYGVYLFLSATFSIKDVNTILELCQKNPERYKDIIALCVSADPIIAIKP